MLRFLVFLFIRISSYVNREVVSKYLSFLSLILFYEVSWVK